VEEKDDTIDDTCDDKSDYLKLTYENVEDWSDWLVPENNELLVSCCDCGLTHRFQFGTIAPASALLHPHSNLVDTDQRLGRRPVLRVRVDIDETDSQREN
jgi:hypothetical protein